MTIKAVQTSYYTGDAYYRTPPPDLESLLLKERIVYLGLPLYSADDVKRQVGIDVTELIISTPPELLGTMVKRSASRLRLLPFVTP
jgi:hypothetical protein